MVKLRDHLRETMKEHNIRQSTVIKYINRNCGYTVESAEYSRILNGVTISPKGNRVIADSWTYVQKLLKEDAT